MYKIKIITDSASDIPKEYEEKYGIDIRCFPITVGDKSFRDRDVPSMEYYDMIDSCDTLPVHSQLTVFEFEEIYEKYSAEGYTDIFYVAINSHGSATYSNACLARENFISEHPELAQKMNIRVIDSTSYSASYGYPVIEACRMAEEGKNPDEIEAYFKECFKSCELILATYNLRFVKKSGRISAAAAFAGELLGLKPIILLAGAETKVLSKVRGENAIIPKLCDIVAERIEKDSPYVLICGRPEEKCKELAKALTKKLGYPPVDIIFRIGSAVASNSGPDMITCSYRAK